METTNHIEANQTKRIKPIADDGRELRGKQLAATTNIIYRGNNYLVPSASHGGRYLVDIAAEDGPTCTCPDYELRRQSCKHVHAVFYHILEEDSADGATTTVTETVMTQRKTYRQNWTAYNAAQTSEKDYVETLLRELCADIPQPPRKPGPGQKPASLRDSVFAAVMKVYTTFSGRRASTDIRECAKAGHMEKPLHYNTIFKCMENPATTAILTRLIEESAAPLAEIENLAGQFAQDSTGFSTVTYDRWFDQKHGKLRAEHPWVKLHVMVGTTTNVVTGVKVSDKHDCPQLPELLAQTAKHFKVKEVSGDKAYLSVKNLKAIDALGAVPFIPFKSNSVGTNKSPLWRRMWAHFTLNSDDFLKRYHRRSNSETTFWMIKSKFSGVVRSKLPTAQVNETLAKVLCHNLTCLVHAIFEFGIDINFAQEAA